MPNLVGIGLSQVPTNSMLGGLAYQDPEHASIKNLDLKNLSQINSEIADTAVDVFVYDTRKDSDGGAWRKRTQNTSWYNETLGTSDRGTRKEFPAVAVIIVTEDDVIIYDGDDPDLPMWMIFESSDTGTPYDTHYLGRSSGFSGFHPSITSVAMLNGILVVGKDGDSSNYAESYTEIRFISDSAFHRHSSGAVDLSNAISGRNGSAGGRITNSSYGSIVDHDINDLVMTVLPNAPIDSATGLPIPTIAVATDGGVSVIKDDGIVVDITSSKAVNDVELVHFDKSGRLYIAAQSSSSVTDVYQFIRYTIPSADISNNVYADNSDATYYSSTTSGASFQDVRPNFNAQYNNGVNEDITHISSNDDGGILGNVNGLSIFAENYSSQGNGLVAYTASEYNTGWMHGDCKGAFLSDTTDIELITNGTFDSNTNGWTAYHSVISVDSNRLRVDDTANAGGWSSAVYEVATVIGKTYQFTFTYTSSSDSFLAGHYAGSYASAGAGTAPTSYTDYGTTSGTYIRLITATSTTTSLILSVNNNGVSFVDNVSFKLAEADRSVNNNGLTVYGTITKSPVATGADLVGYGPFSTSNYLEQPYNSDLLFGTSDFCISGWHNSNSSSTSVYEDIICFGNTGKVGYASNEPGSWFVQTNKDHGFTMYYRTSGGSGHSGWTSYNAGGNFNDHSMVGTGTWYKITLVKNGDKIHSYTNDFYHGSQDVTSGSFTTSSNLSDMTLKIGWDGGTSYNYPSIYSKMALWRISKSAPSTEQVKKMYEDEKVLFQENAKCTLYGLSLIHI